MTQFIIQGHSGQFLRAKLSGGDQAVSAQLLGSTPRPINALWGQGDCSGNFVYQLPETGSYQVEFRPVVRQMGINFSLLASDDPMVDAGIQPDQISIDFGSYASGARMKLVPFAQWRGCSEDDSQPTHWELQGGRVEFQIMQVAGFKKALDPDSSMSRLESTLTDGKLAPVNELPYPSMPGIGLNLSGRQRFLKWDGWKGISWVGAFAQDYMCGFDGKGEFLAYVVQAISDDGRFFVMMRRGISNSQVARRLDQKCNTGPNDKGSKEWDSFFHKDMQAVFDKEMSAADSASFTPNLDQLDAVIKSLKLKR
jgi:hypothetical protein